MKKSGADDISNLFKQFGGQADRYQEIAQANEARLSRERWPLLNAIGSERVSSPPPVPSAPPQAQAPVNPVPASPRPFLSRATAPDTAAPPQPPSRSAEARQEPTLTPPPAPAPAFVAPSTPTSAHPLRDRYIQPDPAPQPAEPTVAAPQEGVTPPSGPSTSLTQLFSKLEAAAETPEPAASTSSLFKRLSQT